MNQATRSEPDGPADRSAGETATPPSVSIIVPTYREAENLRPLVTRITAAMHAAGLDHEIIIVDDDSRDGTEDICAELADPGSAFYGNHPVRPPSSTLPLRLIIRRGERGLSTAVLHGFSLARGEILVCMDADLSHPPESIPRLVSALGEPNADFVIGSRYVPGARTDEHWGILRWLNSKLATLLARPFTTARDPMAGFFALYRTTFASAAPLDPIGYKIGLELIVKCRCHRVMEIPITFADRRAGRSKLSLREQLNYLRHLLRLARFKLTDRRTSRTGA